MPSGRDHLRRDHFCARRLGAGFDHQATPGPSPRRGLALLAERLGNLGYKNVFRYTEGLEDWVSHGFPVTT
ncbi:hypothetical protein [Mesorhizobium sp. M1329]|uniref:hypothetical protein n=1 Tax=Mesorhizobium sp. M1329 TaxID=2957083 RepID=UPI00333872E4